jgi:serine/threonine protein kinase
MDPLSYDSYTNFIGHGAYGIVAILRDDPSRVFEFCSPDNEEAVEAIDREKRILELVGSHPFILTPHWVDERGLCFEYYPLGTLRSYCKSLQPEIPPLTDRLRWCREIVCGVAYLHSKGVMHNDLSPHNILLTPTLNVKICDFGGATMIGELLVGGVDVRFSRYLL